MLTNGKKQTPDVSVQVHQKYIHPPTAFFQLLQAKVRNQESTEKEEGIYREISISNCLELPVFNVIPRQEQQIVCKSKQSNHKKLGVQEKNLDKCTVNIIFISSLISNQSPIQTTSS